MKKNKLKKIAKAAKLSPEWAYVWDEIQKWYGDPRKRETPEELLTRLQNRYAIFDRKQSLKDYIKKAMQP